MLGKLGFKRPSTDRKVKKGKRKLAERTVKGAWVGLSSRGRAYNRATERRGNSSPDNPQGPGRGPWNPVAVAAIRALLRRPAPQRADAEPSARLK